MKYKDSFLSPEPQQLFWSDEELSPVFSRLRLCSNVIAIFLPQPPLPEEDYPPEDYPADDQPDIYDELSASGPPPTLPKEYTLSHVGRTVIPRATLDRSSPAGWNLTVDPNGTWVFTSEHSPEQVATKTDKNRGIKVHKCLQYSEDSLCFACKHFESVDTYVSNTDHDVSASFPQNFLSSGPLTQSLWALMFLQNSFFLFFPAQNMQRIIKYYKTYILLEMMHPLFIHFCINWNVWWHIWQTLIAC